MKNQKKKKMYLAAMVVIASGYACASEAGGEDSSKSLSNDPAVKYKGVACVKNNQTIEVTTTKLLDALREYEARFGITITKYIDEQNAIDPLGEKYFRFTDSVTGNQGLIDIHIIRGEQEICPKQDLDFKLLSMDKIVYIAANQKENIADTLVRLPGVEMIPMDNNRCSDSKLPSVTRLRDEDGGLVPLLGGETALFCNVQGSC